MVIYMIRHSMTQGNKKRCYIGSTDEELCVEGYELIKQRKYPHVEGLIVSPKKRCIQTAKSIYKSLEPIIIDDLRECDFGDFEGRNYEQLKNNVDYIEWLNKNGTIPFPGGEDQMEFRDRCVKGFDHSVRIFKELGVVHGAMVVHGGTIMAILERYARPKKDFYYWKLENAEYIEIKLDEHLWQDDEKERFISVEKR